MKKIFIAISLVVFIVASAQQNEKSNLVKLNTTAFAFRNLQLGYERVITKRFSTSANIGFLLKGNIPYASSFNIDENLRNLSLNGTTFTIEPRFYIGEGYGKGFYFAPYYRYSHYKLNDLNYNVEISNFNTKEPIHITGKLNAHSAGLMLGAQWFVGRKKNIVIDAWFIGVHYGSSKGELNGTTERKLTSQEQEYAKKDLDNLVDISIIKYDTNVNESGASMKIDGPWIGLRSGISVGYRF